MAMIGRKLKSCSEPDRYEYDVFLSFGGLDTRHGFTSHLYSALEQSEVNVFKDNEELTIGGEINDIYKKAIENSRIAIVVLSPGYASFCWCLDEVAYIMECRKSKGLRVVPVFYGVDPIDVRHQRGRYEEAFAHHEGQYGSDEVERWRVALRELTQLKGLTLGDRSETMLVKEIVSVVLSKLEMTPFLDPANLVGRYDVFLCLRGLDTRHGFTGYLYSALVQSDVSVFMDDEELPIGEEITCALLKAIENSRIAIVVFSHGFAFSKWCLNDVAKIMECHKSKGLIVLPVFYGIFPSQVGHLRGTYEGAFASHERCYDKHSVERWRIALKEAANLEGFALEYGDEAYVVQEIVCHVLSRLDDIQFHVPANLVGMSSHLKAVYKLLDMDTDEVRMVALCGMGGLGKTTIAKTIFNKIGQSFRYKGFSANVRETCEDSLIHGLLKLQQRLLSQMGTEVKIWDVDEGSNEIKRRCRRSRTLLVIDDINHPQQLEKLAGACDWFSPGSKVIITTRNRDLLNDRKEIRLYEVPLLGHPDAYLLFKRTLLLENDEINAYKEVITELLDYMQGLPLAITVVAANLRGKIKSDWASVLKEIPYAEIHDVLELSYDGLNDLEKTAFLDIACFFKGQPLTYVRNVLECCEVHPDSIMKVLLSRYLISIKYDKVDMHNMIQEMGRRIVRRQSPEEPGKRSRLWSQDDILQVLTGDTGTEKIEGMKLEFSSTTEVKFGADALRRMRRLRVFMAYNVRPSRNSIHFPKQLRWLEWHGYPFPSLPLHEDDNKELVGLYVSKSCIILSNDDLKSSSNLKFINFSYCTSLREIPDLTSLSNLESLDVEQCEELLEVHQSVGLLEKLVHLNFLNCIKLHTFPSRLNSKVLQDLILKGCPNLLTFPELIVKMENLKEIYLDETAIYKLPSSIENLNGLKELYLENCGNLRALPSSIFKLEKLQRISFAGCSELVEFPKYKDKSSGFFPELIYFDLQRCRLQEIDFLRDLGCKTSLKHLDLSGSKLVTVPGCIEEFISLQQLNLTNCKQLHDILGLPPNVKNLIAKGCELLEWHVPLSGMLKSQFKESPSLRQIDFSGCCNLTRNVSTTVYFFSIEDLPVDSQIKILYPGSEIPKYFDHQKPEGSLSFPVNSELYNNIAGLIFCVIIGSGGRKIASVSCRIQVYSNNQMTYHIADMLHLLEMDHMWLVYVPCTMVWGWKTIMQEHTEFSVLFDLSGGNLKCCGVHLVLKEDGSSDGLNSWMHQRFNERYLQA